jgi:sialate O-acetylesterase
MCRLLLLLSLVLSASAASSVEKVAQKYRHAILQSGLPITIDARVRGASQVSVKLAGVTYEAKVGGQGKAGRARLEIPALPAGGPYDMVFSDDKGRSATAEDVYLSDVWLCIGQSNMFSHDQNAQQGHLGTGHRRQLS